MPAFRGFLVALSAAFVIVGVASLNARAGDPPTNANGQAATGKSTTDKSTTDKNGADKTNVGKTGADKSTNGKSPATSQVGKSAAAKKTNVRPPAPLSAEREAAALAFGRAHHPELAALIDKLHRDNRRDYDRAIRELSQACERLTRLKKQSAEQYELSLAAWKLDSRAQLLAARLTISQTPALEAELKQVLADRADVRLKEFKFEQARLEDRLTKVKASIQALESDKNGLVEKDLLRIKRSIASRRRPAKPANKSAIASKAPVTEPPRPPAIPTTAASVAPPADASATSRSNKQQ
jgi:hypothetical protein